MPEQHTVNVVECMCQQLGSEVERQGKANKSTNYTQVVCQMHSTEREGVSPNTYNPRRACAARVTVVVP